MNNNLPSSELIIRPALFNDIPYIQEIAHKTWPITYEAILGKEQLTYMLDRLYSNSSLQQQMENRQDFFLALEQFKPIGFASFSHVSLDIYKLQKLYVLPVKQKTGAGKALLTTVEEVVKSMGAKKLQLNVNRKNIARSFYERNNFFIIKEEDIDIENGFFMNDYIMEKDL